MNKKEGHTMKRFLGKHAWVTSLLAFFFLLVLDHGALAQQYKWKLGHVAPPVHPWHLASVEFAKGVDKDTNGRLTIEIHHSGSVGSEKDMIEQARFGALDMCLMSTGSLRLLDPRLEIEELPYAWPTRQHAFRAFDGELGDKLKSILEPKGIYILAWMENGYRHMTNRVRPIYKPEDLKGLKIRTAELSMRLDTFRLLGVQPTPMSFPELFMALQQGTVDGQENPLVVIYSSKFYEVQKYLSLTGHIWSSADFMINKGVWDKLPKDLQNVVRQNAIKAAQYERQLSQKADSELIDELKKKGMQVNEVDTSPFKLATQPIYQKYRDTYGKDLMELVEKYSK
jgi:tripartite ATP-independent transporter DctP family solute receptor